MSEGNEVTAVTTISHPVGLHARPAITFTKLAKTFKSAEIQIRGGDDQAWVDAKSIVRVMAQKLRTGAVLQMRARGTDAGPAIEALKALVERDFDEAIEG
ncbi:MAG: HPr family phosphocarrier protein [Alphaproteobacteria bacterium]|nr:HPr family phosphocarrier protein [Alphaproteobacteria bacterium]